MKMKMKNNPIILYTTTPNIKLAKKISKSLLDKKFAACINIISGVTSLYQWEGKLCEDREFVLIIKTSSNSFKDCQKIIESIHTYNTPALIKLNITGGSKKYLNWILKNS